MSVLHSIMFLCALIACALQFTFNTLTDSWYMAIPKAILLALTLSLGACASLIQSTSATDAYKQYKLQDYERTLELITRAENAKDTTPEMKAELTYLKAQTHEKLGQQRTANTLYEYLIKEHKDSQYGYLASKKMKMK